jgi:hypothetical protein
MQIEERRDRRSPGIVQKLLEEQFAASGREYVLYCDVEQ